MRINAGIRRLGAPAALASAVVLAAVPSAEAGERWRDLDVVASPVDCPSEYDPEEYHYHRPTLLRLLKDRTGGVIFSPYTRRVFIHDDEVHVEHVVARKEAHYSGLCNQDLDTRLAFASDLLNLTLAAKGLNRAKGECDAASWLPPRNRCWFARRVLEVRRKYKLTIDRAEADALEAILSGCEPHEEFMHCVAIPRAKVLGEWDTDDSGQLSCRELKAAGVSSPIDPAHRAWPFVKDGNCDGTAC